MAANPPAAVRWALRPLRAPAMLAAAGPAALAQAPHRTIVLHAARLLEVDSGRVLAPGEVLVEGERWPIEWP